MSPPAVSHPRPGLRRRRCGVPNLPDVDDTLRRVSDMLLMAESCRRRVCQKAKRCQGGYGPPCYLEQRQHFARALLDQMQDYRNHWDQERARIEAALWVPW